MKAGQSARFACVNCSYCGQGSRRGRHRGLCAPAEIIPELKPSWKGHSYSMLLTENWWIWLIKFFFKLNYEMRNSCKLIIAKRALIKSEGKGPGAWTPPPGVYLSICFLNLLHLTVIACVILQMIILACGNRKCESALHFWLVASGSVSCLPWLSWQIYMICPASSPCVKANITYSVMHKGPV